MRTCTYAYDAHVPSYAGITYMTGTYPRTPQTEIPQSFRHFGGRNLFWAK